MLDECMLKASKLFYLLAPCALSLCLVLGGCETHAEPVPPSRPSLHKSVKTTKALASATYVGRESCGACHAEILKKYQGSQHDRALEIAHPKTVLAPFSGEGLKGKNISARFRAEKEEVIIESGASHPVKWTIGVEPLQQYLLETTKGRVQTFAAAYDTRPLKKGSLGWYFLDDLDVPNGDLLHWEGSALNWNFMCADCHSTNLQKNYDFESDTYKTKFSEIDVSCEACHGPASNHLELAKAYQDTKLWPNGTPSFGFERRLTTKDRLWTRKPGTRIASLVGGDRSEQNNEVNACAPCHSRRSDLGNIGLEASASFFERYLLRRVDSDLYFADGQIKEEVYVYGSFMQSEMFKEGVTCSDCHDPHTAELRAPEEKLCFQCHDPMSYDRPKHHMHKAETASDSARRPLCVDCHMPQRSYMGIDKRRDHRFGIPRPGLSETLGSPSACQSCHQDKNNQWAAQAIERVHGKEDSHSFALAFQAAERNSPQAHRLLASIVSNQKEPALTRASALGRWSRLEEMSRPLADALKLAARSQSPLIRIAAADGSASLPPPERLALLKPLWKDKLRSIRISAAMAALELRGLLPVDEARLRKALLEAKTSRAMDADSLEGATALASIELRLGNPARALEIFQIATQRFAFCEVVYANWADALRSLNRDQEAGEILKSGLARFGKNAGLHHANGLWLIRQSRKEEALAPLKKGFELASSAMRRRYGYVYALALAEAGKKAQGIRVLRVLVQEFPQATEIAQALASYQ